jgi:hypothetical protein
MNTQRHAFYWRAILAVFAVVGILVFAFSRPEPARHDLWLPSSFNPAPNGHLALYDALQRRHWPVARWREDYRQLPNTRTGNVMIIARPEMGFQRPFHPLEIERLAGWVSRGNRLILLGDYSRQEDGRNLLAAVGVRISSEAPSFAQQFYEGLDLEQHRTRILRLTPRSSAAAAGRRQIEITQAEPLQGLSRQAVSEWVDAPYTHIASIPLGQGDVLLISSTSLIGNTFVLRAANLAAFLEFLQPRGQMPSKVWFEEFHHGYRSSFDASEIIGQPGLKLAAAQIGLGLLAFLASQLVRFGVVLPLPRETPRSSLEFVRSMGGLYRRADLRNEIVRYLYEQTLQAVLRKLNLPPRASHDLIASRLAESFPHLPSWKKLAQRFDSDKFVQGLPPGGWLRVAQDLVRIHREMT